MGRVGVEVGGRVRSDYGDTLHFPKMFSHLSTALAFSCHKLQITQIVIIYLEIIQQCCYCLSVIEAHQILENRTNAVFFRDQVLRVH